MYSYRKLVADISLCNKLPKGAFYGVEFSWGQRWSERGGKLIKLSPWFVFRNVDAILYKNSKKEEDAEEIWSCLPSGPDWPVHHKVPAPTLRDIVNDLLESGEEMTFRHNGDGTFSARYRRYGETDEYRYLQIADTMENAALKVWFLVNKNKKEEK